MKTINVLAFLIFINVFSSSCLREVFCEEGSGQRLTETFDIDDFTGVDLQEAGNVTITQSDTFEVIVTARESILDKLQTDVNGGIWEIDLGRECFIDLELEVEIKMPLLNELHLSGSGLIEVGDFQDQGNLDISISGSGDIKLNEFNGTEDIDVRISGSGELVAQKPITGIDRLNVEITGSGYYDCYEIETKELDARISGSGNIYTTVEDYINVRITGSGNLHYKGNPTIDANITGSGRIVDEN